MFVESHRIYRRLCNLSGCGHDEQRSTKAFGVVSPERLKALERENRELKHANETVRKASAFLPPGSGFYVPALRIRTAPYKLFSCPRPIPCCPLNEPATAFRAFGCIGIPVSETLGVLTA
ncbi:MAG: hypothetical protein FD164_1404 [Nitrospirae bacterium]|nr:MAG: hypothetical protein FD164_1404 [Nitrospirota bacterium]